MGIMFYKTDLFQHGVSYVLISLLQEKYTDVTVVCEDKFYPCHKLILSTYSSYFTHIFESTMCRHPVVVLRDVAASDWAALLTYMYKGRVSVIRSHLPCLIQVASHLKIKGFAQSEDNLKPSEPSENHPKTKGFVLSENHVSAAKKRRSGRSDDWASRQHKHPRRAKEEKDLDTMTPLPCGTCTFKRFTVAKVRIFISIVWLAIVSQ